MNVAGPGFHHADLLLPLVGDYQPSNAALALATAHLLDEITDQAVRDGLASTHWPGRLQLIGSDPRVILDGGHNPAALVKTGAALRGLIGTEKLIVVFAMLRERDPVQLIAALRTLRPDAAVFTEPAGAEGHAVPASELTQAYGPNSHAVKPASAALALAKELAGRDGNVLVCGSLYLVGEILGLDH
jgi:folylpolyglutamate synthase/dihydropteroate synthase